ncbi:MAG: hypothetical protein IGBAC_0646 [Ignavibacteriae bacterium]|nr:MAG: hypothetical protein IGBAC_0646 [Ignavibacteriota bacterium]
MQERIVEIIVFILSEIKFNNKELKDVNLSALEKMGFSKSELNAAFSWLSDRLYLLEKYKENKASQKTFRILHDIEKYIFSPQAYGYLLQLKELDIIDEVDMEYIIDILMRTSQSVDISEINSLIASIVLQRAGNYFGNLNSYENESVN